MTATLPAGFLTRPLAHRGLHDRAALRPENSVAAFLAARDAGYGIELDLQLSADGQAMVFHDDTLERLTHETGPVVERTAAELQGIALRDASGAGIPTFADILHLVNGTVPLLVELKDQDGQMGPNVGRLERAAVAAVQGYAGDVAFMSFNPHSTTLLAQLLPDVPCGIVTSAYDPKAWTDLDAATCDTLRDIPDFDRSGACFISHEASDLSRPRVQALRASGIPVLCWTITSPQQEAEARTCADNVTFEQYLAPLKA